MAKTTIFEMPMPRVHIELINMVRLLEPWRDAVLAGNFWRLYWNSEGGAGVFLDGVRRELLPERLYLLPPGCGLRTWCDSPRVAQLYIHFEAMQYRGSRQTLCTEVEITPLRRELLERLTGQGFAPGNLPRRGLWGLALAADVLAAQPPEVLGEGGLDRRFVDVCNHLKLHFNEDLSLADLASLVHMSPNAFLRKFRTLYRTTPHQYLLHLRYVRGAQLLLAGTPTLKEIARAVGIRDASQFSRGFKAVYGLSPTAFRRQAPTREERTIPDQE